MGKKYDSESQRVSPYTPSLFRAVKDSAVIRGLENTFCKIKRCLKTGQDHKKGIPELW